MRHARLDAAPTPPEHLTFAVVNSDYDSFLRTFYSEAPEAKEEPYDAQLQRRFASVFGVADFYARNLRALGYDAHSIYYNNPYLQAAWARENGLQVLPELRTDFPRWSLRSRGVKAWLHAVLLAQLREIRPTVLLIQDLTIPAKVLIQSRPSTQVVVGQHASPLPRRLDVSPYDLMISSLPNLVDYFRRRGIRSELHRLAFEPQVLNEISADEPTIPVSFVGSVSSFHSDRAAWLQAVARTIPLQIWSQDAEAIRRLGLEDHYQGQAWGRKMYRVLASSQITLNQHGAGSGGYANNMRLYEATGVGTLLLTDRKTNLGDLFHVGQEVVDYGSSAECVDRVRFFLDRPQEAAEIAAKGQERTLDEHNYLRRMEELVALLLRPSTWS